MAFNCEQELTYSITLKLFKMQKYINIERLTPYLIGETLEFYGKETKRKQIIFLKKWLEEDTYRNEYIGKQFEQGKHLAMYLGDTYNRYEYSIMTKNADAIEQYLITLKN